MFQGLEVWCHPPSQQWTLSLCQPAIPNHMDRALYLVPASNTRRHFIRRCKYTATISQYGKYQCEWKKMTLRRKTIFKHHQELILWNQPRKRKCKCSEIRQWDKSVSCGGVCMLMCMCVRDSTSNRFDTLRRISPSSQIINCTFSSTSSISPSDWHKTTRINILTQIINFQSYLFLK